MKIINAPALSLDPGLYQFALKTMREQSMFILPRFYCGPDMNNYDLWKLSSWYDAKNECTKALQAQLDLISKPIAQQFYPDPELRELMFCCAGVRHNNKMFTDTNYLNGVGHRIHYVHEGEGWLTDVNTREKIAFAPGSVMVFEPSDAGRRWHVWFTTPVISVTVAVWAPASAKKNWVLFAEHAVQQHQPQELKTFDI